MRPTRCAVAAMFKTSEHGDGKTLTRSDEPVSTCREKFCGGVPIWIGTVYALDDSVMSSTQMV